MAQDLIEKRMFSLYFGGYIKGSTGNSIWLGGYDYDFLKKYVKGASLFSNDVLDSLVMWIDLNKEANVWEVEMSSLNVDKKVLG